MAEQARRALPTAPTAEPAPKRVVASRRKVVPFDRRERRHRENLRLIGVLLCEDEDDPLWALVGPAAR